MNKSVPDPAEFKLYKKRWVIMGIFVIYAINGGIQWLQFSIISDVIIKYYGVSATQVEWTTTIFLLSYVIFIIPSLYVMDRVGLKNTMIIGATGVTVGTWIKVFSVAPDRFMLVLIGQAFPAIFLILTFGLAARFTAIWFGAGEISIAGALALLGDQLGTALGFIIPPTFVKDGTLENIGRGLKQMHCWVAGFSTVVWILVILFFKSQPRLPPSAAQAKQRSIESENVSTSLITIFRKRTFILIFISYGISLGSFNAIATLLNQLILGNFQGHSKDAGNIGFVLMISGMIGSIIIGKVLDKTRLFKESAVFLTIGSTVTIATFTWSLKSNNITYVYIVALFIGFFTLGYYGTGFQMGIEVTYPVSEEISSAVMLLSAQVFGSVIVIVYGYAVKLFGDVYSNIGLTAIFAISAICAILIPPNLKRQEAEKSIHDVIEEKKEFI